MAEIVLVSESATRDVLDGRAVLGLVEGSYALQANGQFHYGVPPIMSGTAGRQAMRYRIKSVGIEDDDPVVGVRISGEDAGGAGRGTRLLFLASASDGRPLAVIDEHWLYLARTAASALIPLKYAATEYDHGSSLAIIGTGHVAEALLELVSDALPFVDTVALAGKCEEDSRRLAERASGKCPSLNLICCPSVTECVGQSRMIITCTSTREPLLSAGDLQAGTIVCTIGYYEIAPNSYRQFDRHIVDDWSMAELAPDMRAMLDSGQFAPSDIDAECVDVVTRRAPARTDAGQRLLIRCDGVAMQDVILARAAYRRTIAHQRGTSWDPAG